MSNLKQLEVFVPIMEAPLKNAVMKELFLEVQLQVEYADRLRWELHPVLIIATMQER